MVEKIFSEVCIGALELKKLLEEDSDIVSYLSVDGGTLEIP